LQRVLLGEGVRVFTAAQVTRVQRQEDGSRRIDFEQEGQEHTLQVSEILVAAGRVPQTANLNLEAAGVETRRGWLQVDDEFRTNVPHIWGAGDVSGGMQFTHVAAAKGDAVFRNAMLGEHTTLDLRAIPYTVFSDPEVGHVGITEQQAIEQGIEYEVSRFDPTELDRSIIARDETGLIKLIATPGGEEILGTHILAAHGGDLINEIALAMQTRLTLRQLAGTIHAYPTLPESLRWAATSFLGE
jgi:pyruvate/2-oxoglutarate dehydrogenase complex dihydrolipoamide dehydrogenase (E3) component